jgi:hypothetical protein
MGHGPFEWMIFLSNTVTKNMARNETTPIG